MIASAGRGSRLGGPIAASVVLHAAAVAAIVAMRPPAPPAMPPMYKVNIVAAPPGPRQAGIVAPQPAQPEPPRPDRPPPTRAEVNPRQMPAPTTRPQPARRQPPPPATPNPRPAEQTPAKDAPRAGGGPTGDVGTDVATVRTEGIDFPFPGYLNNIVRQIAMRFAPDNPNAALRAEIAFLIRRDGSVTGVRFITQSGRYDFDLEAMGAVEAAANAGAFGPLPEGYQQDVLPVIFSFDPRLIR
ncbi:MAG TPA: TonB C-terminal domain-containing protein [Gemmatimonadaceae bacterium]